MKTSFFSLFRYNKFEFGNQTVSQFVIFEYKYLCSFIFFYFHKSVQSQDRFHTHAFNAISFKLFGQYTEYVLNDETKQVSERRRKSFFQFFPRESFHKIGKSNGCLTFLISGPWKKTWKEYKDDQLIEYTWNRK